MIKNNKVMTATRCSSIRELVDVAIRLNIPREDVVTILKESECYVLIYYYGDNE